jgi:hypothetical protein
LVLSLVVASGFLLHPVPVRSQAWSNEFGPSPSGQGLNGTGWAFLIYQNNLVVGGDFTQAGPIVANHVAAWDGTQWNALGGGVSADFILALAEFNGELIAAGGSSYAEGSMYRWNGVTWSPLPAPSTPSGFWALQSHGGLLFANTGGSVARLSWWDGTVWSGVDLPTVPSSDTPSVFAMTVFQGQLYLAGGMGGVAYPDAGFLYSWDGSAFHGPGYVFGSDRMALQACDNVLYVGGWGYPEGGPSGPSGSIAIWDGTSWVPLDTNPVSDVLAMGTYSTRLAVADGGAVTTFVGTLETPQQLGLLMGYAVQSFQGGLYVTGPFRKVTVAGNVSVPSYYIAKWSEPATAVERTPASSGSLRVESAPNPFNPSVTLSIHVPNKDIVAVTICDAAGRAVRHLASGVRDAGPYQLTWDGADDAGNRLASGVYFARVVAGHYAVTRKLILLK